MIRILRPGLIRRYISTLQQPVNELPSTYIQPQPDKNDEIVIAMSSGVDSSVAAALYASYPNVRGVYMANWSQTAKCTEADWNDVQKVCNHLKIPCQRVNFEREYWNDVFQPMVKQYEQGLTPNPDTGCNKYIKFGVMIDHLTKILPKEKKWWLVTGHYARIMQHQPTGEHHLLRGYSQLKDQSFYLSSINKQILPRILMPIGHYIKSETRDLAKKHNLHIAEKPDSQGLCFVSQGQHKFRDFLNEYIPPNPGNIITEDGKVWGKHNGLWHATIGQRSAVSMPQGDPNYTGVWFVSEKRVETNELVIARHGDNPVFFHDKLNVDNWVWLNKPKDLSNIQLQFRSLQKPVPVKEFKVEGKNMEIHMSEKSRAMAPGQNVALYEGSHVLGSGVIRKAFT